MSASVLHNGTGLITKGSDVLFKGQLGSFYLKDTDDYAIADNTIVVPESDAFAVVMKVILHANQANGILFWMIKGNSSYRLFLNGNTRRLVFHCKQSTNWSRGIVMHGTATDPLPVDGKTQLTIIAQRNADIEITTGWNIFINNIMQAKSVLSSGTLSYPPGSWSVQLGSTSGISGYSTPPVRYAMAAKINRLLTFDERTYIHNNERGFPDTISISELEFLLYPKSRSGNRVLDKSLNNNHFTLNNVVHTLGDPDNTWMDWYFNTPK